MNSNPSTSQALRMAFRGNELELSGLRLPEVANLIQDQFPDADLDHLLLPSSPRKGVQTAVDRRRIPVPFTLAMPLTALLSNRGRHCQVQIRVPNANPVPETRRNGSYHPPVHLTDLGELVRADRLGFGCIEYDDERDELTKIQCLANIFATSLMTVVTSHNAERSHLARELGRKLGCKSVGVGLPPTGPLTSPEGSNPRICLVSVDQLGKAQPPQGGVVILTGSAGWPDQEAQLVWRALNGPTQANATCRLYRMRSRRWRPRGDHERLRELLVGGHTLYHAKRPMIGVWAPRLTDPFPWDLSDPDQLWKYRRERWQSEHDHRTVSDLARSCVDNRAHRKLFSDGYLQDPLQRHMRWAMGSANRIDEVFRVLVESREHAERLRRYLPDWEVLTAEQRGYRLPKSIITLQHARRFGIDADVLIRADLCQGDLRDLPDPTEDATRGIPMSVTQDPTWVVHLRPQPDSTSPMARIG